MLSPQSMDVVERFWAQKLECERGVLSQAGVTIVPRRTPGGSVLVWARRETLVVSTPQEVATAFADREGLMEEAGLRRLLGDRVAMVLGPAYLGYVDAATFRADEAADVRLLTPGDRGAVDALRLACGAVDWERGGPHWPAQEAAGRWVDGALVAVGGYEMWGDAIAQLTVVTHPAHRGMGHGRGVVSTITGAVLARGLVPQYRTLESSEPSVGIAGSLGFVGVARTMAVRLRR